MYSSRFSRSSYGLSRYENAEPGAIDNPDDARGEYDAIGTATPTPDTMVEESIDYLMNMIMSMFTALVTGMAGAVAIAGLKMLLALVAVITLAGLAYRMWSNRPKT